jgi:hypothetical protein
VARAAISNVIGEIKRDVATSVDPRAWLQVHPWTTMASAAVAGFVAAAAVVPSKEQQALKRLAAIEKALSPSTKRRDADAADDDPGAAQVEKGRGSFLSGVAGHLLRAIQPVLMSAVTAGVTAKVAEPNGADGAASGNGAHDPTNASGV